MSNWMGLNAPEYEIVNQLKREVAALRAEIERKDAVMRLVLDVLLYHRDDPDMIEWAEGKVLRTVSTEESIDDS